MEFNKKISRKYPQLKYYFLFILFIFLGCATPKGELEIREHELGTHGKSMEIYHSLAVNPHDRILNHEGYLVAVEKVPREGKGINAPKNLDTDKFRLPVLIKPLAQGKDSKITQTAHEARKAHMAGVTDDGKVMLVSHIIAYENEGATGSEFKPRFVHNIYPSPTEVKLESPCSSKIDNIGYYEQGWRAIDWVECEIREKMISAEAADDPYTHFLVLSMGWNNDPQESIIRYNQIVDNLHRSARASKSGKFKPMIVCFSWPSVWASKSSNFVWQKINHIFSYGNKADDADEVGYTIGNYIVNDMLSRLKKEARDRNKPPVKIVLIGHSMGARLLTRAFFSNDLLKDGDPYKDIEADYVFGLEGAFSINRFVKGAKLKFPLVLFSKGEGHPYSDYDFESGKSKFIMTWSEKDNANPFSTFLNGSAHIGGKIGFKRSQHPKKKDSFSHAKWPSDSSQKEIKPLPSVCDSLADKKKVLMVDMTEAVQNHNDICDSQMGYFVWTAMECLSPERSERKVPLFVNADRREGC